MFRKHTVIGIQIETIASYLAISPSEQGEAIKLIKMVVLVDFQLELENILYGHTHTILHTQPHSFESQ